MNFHFPSFFRPKPAHREVRYVVPTKREITEAQRRLLNLQASVRGQLAVYNATTTPEQRAAEREAYWAKARAELVSYASELKRTAR